MNYLFTFSVVLLMLTGCASPEGYDKLLSDNKLLHHQIDQCEVEVAQIEQDKKELQAELSEFDRLNRVITKEKINRTQETKALRADTRQFIKKQMTDYRSFLKQSELADHIGYELIERTKTPKAKGQLLLDAAHTAPSAGMINGVAGYFVSPTTFYVKVLRQIQNKLLVIWESDELTISNPGVASVDFDVPISIEKGDYFAYYFPKEVNVPYDSGTGKVLFKGKDIHIGDMLSISSLKGTAEKRAYSLSMFGIFFE